MKRIRHWIYVLLFRPLFLLTLILFAALLTFIQKPERFLTPPRLEHLAEKAKEYAAGKAVSVKWTKLKLEIHSQSFFRKEISLNARDFCFNEPVATGCLSKLSFRAIVGLRKYPPGVEELGPIEIVSHDLFLDLSLPSPNSQSPSPAGFRFSLPDWLSSSRILPIAIELTPLQVKTKPKEIARGELQILSQPISPEGSVDFKISAGTQRKNRNLKLTANLSLSPENIRSKLNLSITGGRTGMILRDCKLNLKTPHSGSQNLNLYCPIEMDLPILPSRIPKNDFPKKIALTINSQIEGNFLPFDPKKRLNGFLNIEMVPFQTPTFTGRAHIGNQFEGTLNSSQTGTKIWPKIWPKIWNGTLKSDIDIELSVPSFQKLAATLKQTAFEIPAPFGILEGPTVFSAKGAFDPRKGSFPLEFTTDLHAPTEDFRTKTTGKIEIENKEIHAAFDVDLSNIKIALPKISLAAAPRLTADPRLAKVPAQPKRESPSPKSFHYSLHVHTPPEHPIRLTSNLVQRAVPIGVNIFLTEQSPASGKISIQPFPLKLFEREVHLKKFDLSLQDPVKNSLVDGLIDVNYVDYDIHVQVVNTVGKPKVILTSDPPLENDQILSVLLFGNPPDQLDADQASSVGNTQAAIADGAIGLASLYTLASTPIQSVGYDPSTGVVTAKVKLGKGTSLNLGAQQNELAQAGIRQRLGGHWSIETDLNDPTDPENRTLSALLVWSLRY